MTTDELLLGAFRKLLVGDPHFGGWVEATETGYFCVDVTVDITPEEAAAVIAEMARLKVK